MAEAPSTGISLASDPLRQCRKKARSPIAPLPKTCSMASTLHTDQIARELSLRPAQVCAVSSLLESGATVPFIARYRKEATGELDEVAITNIRDALTRLAELDARRAAILESLSERNLLTDALKAELEQAQTLSALEDAYLPYRPKRRTRAQTAREHGLSPLAEFLLSEQENPAADPCAFAASFVDPAKEVPDVETALAGARDIVAEAVAENTALRSEMRTLFDEEADAVSAVVPGKETEGAKFQDYFNASEPLRQIPGHRLLALLRGEKEGILSLSIRPEKAAAQALARSHFVAEADTPCSRLVAQACDAAYTRLLAPAMEVEARLRAFTRASDEAIRVFSENLRELLMAAPLGRKAVLAIDPGIRTGCKVVVLDPQGKLLEDCVVQLAQSDAKRREAAEVLLHLADRYSIAAVAIGNGTYGRETLAFVSSLRLPAGTAVVSVNESGASIYSASEVAREEFPDKDITVRGAVSIGRRLMDPLAELVKLDPKSIGVGQYQHDVDQTHLRRALDDTVLSCVNAVGVEVNTASKQLLTHVSGLGPALAASIVEYRNANGPFLNRKALMKVPRMGPKSFEQAAGFLRISGGDTPLDASAVHPESYPIVEQMAADLGCSVNDLLQHPEKAKSLSLAKYCTDSVGLPTLRDIIAELAKPGRDPRKQFEVFAFAEGVHVLEDLHPGMKLPGIVTNVTNFGAFIDVGVHQDGLVHVSELRDAFTANPADVVKVGQRVTVRVLAVDLQRRRISLSMRSNNGGNASPRPPSHLPGRPRDTKRASAEQDAFHSSLGSLFDNALKH